LNFFEPYSLPIYLFITPRKLPYEIKYRGGFLFHRLTLYLQEIHPLNLNIRMLVWFNSPIVSEHLHIPKQPVEIGCNHLYQKRNLTYCCAYDPRTRDQITKDLNTKNTEITKNTKPIFYTRNGAKSELFNEVNTPNRLQPEDSGTLAIALAIFYLKAKTINIIGCGWHLDETDSLFDNQYTHKKIYNKGSNRKLQLLRTYQKEFNVAINFISNKPVDTYLGWSSFEEFLHNNH